VEAAGDAQGVVGVAGRVEPLRLAAAEVPAAVLADVAVVVDERHHDPLVAHLVLGPAVDEPLGGVRPVKSMTRLPTRWKVIR